MSLCPATLNNRLDTLSTDFRSAFVKNRPPLGSWDKYEITAHEGHVVVVLNGELVNEGHNADPSEGNVCLQSEGWPVQYRNVTVKELEK